MASFLHCFASEDKSKRAFLAPNGAVHTDDFPPEPLYGRLRCSRCFEYTKSLFPMGLVSPLKEHSTGTETHFLLGRFALAPCALSRYLFWGLAVPEEPLGGYIPYSLTGYIPKAFATICRPNTCSLPDGEWLQPSNGFQGGIRLRQACIPLYRFAGIEFVASIKTYRNETSWQRSHLASASVSQCLYQSSDSWGNVHCRCRGLLLSDAFPLALVVDDPDRASLPPLLKSTKTVQN